MGGKHESLTRGAVRPDPPANSSDENWTDSVSACQPSPAARAGNTAVAPHDLDTAFRALADRSRRLLLDALYACDSWIRKYDEHLLNALADLKSPLEDPMGAPKHAPRHVYELLKGRAPPGRARHAGGLTQESTTVS